MTSATSDKPAIGALVAVRGQRWVVSDVEAGTSSTLVSLQSVEEGRYGHTLDVIWEVEPGSRVLPGGSLPEVTAFDPPARLAAFLDAIRWSAVTSADVKMLQAPFRSGVALEDYQLEPVARAVEAPRVNLLLADDVGLGKTIEAGLVAQELLLTQRARRIMVVCPAGLTLKWKDEMAEKFGLDFTIIDTERCAIVRRTHGSAANPFEIHPLTIVSLPWLRGQKAQRLIDEMLDPTGEKRAFDLLILDEAHHVAPAAPKQVYAVDSQQTKLIRRLSPHFTHRLFLSATPHNGYQASFTALLETLDDQRFARGIEPDSAALTDVVVRRLKRDIKNADGSERFRRREAHAMPVLYPADEREIHELLKEFAEVRRRRLTKQRGRKAADLVTLLLKKRLFSSPAAFLHTVGVYLETVKGRVADTFDESDDVPEWLEEFADYTASLDDESLAEAEDDAVNRAHPLQEGATRQEVELLERMQQWAKKHAVRPDAKARELITYLTAVCRPDTHWENERVVVFTEYRDTQTWLAGLLTQEGLGGDRLKLLHGGMSTEEREQVRQAFQKDPAEYDVRILIATDAAGEGIDLQNHCHRLVNYDIPFNPNKLEQRIGRIDRYGQRHTPDIRHFIGTGWTTAVDSYEADLEFLARIAEKVARQQKDLGPVNAVISERVQRRMLGEDVGLDDVDRVAPTEDVPVETDIGAQVKKLRARLDETVGELRITPGNIKRVVDTALDLARQQPLKPHLDEKHLIEGLFEVPTLTASWERASAGLLEKITKDGAPPKQRPVTFDPDALTELRDDVVLAHLNHPLVAMSTRLLRAAVSNPDIGLNRVTAVISDDPALETTLIGAYARFVLVGGDGMRLHEEVIYAGGWAQQSGRFRRLDAQGALNGILDRGLNQGLPASPHLHRRLAEVWGRMRPGLVDAIEARMRTRRDSLDNALAKRQEAELNRIAANFDRFAATLRATLAAGEEDDGLFSVIEATKDEQEIRQYLKDRDSWQARLDRLDEERRREQEAVAARYRDFKEHLFPVAVIFVVPRQEASR
ncbi:DISARM system SNF2-like helicase DrmD [Herbidospora daliensis]|uniref:DISARM system SNF2-like helicase DrmD n=1 Tax=Herbidospora daliensis TaxID=295585 RepID=UPI000782862C|nr:DISARM system SNF2-like helicase DrmD [Herbidospora daliensis]